MKTKYFPPLLLVSLYALCFSPGASARGLQFIGNTRACAGAVPSDIHQLHLTVRGFASRESITWSFNSVTRQDDKGRLLLPPRFSYRGHWLAGFTGRADKAGVVRLRILSGQTAEKPFLVAKARRRLRGKLQCDFGAPEMVRRFPESFLDDPRQWQLPQPDYGYLFDGGLPAVKREYGKVYLKFRLNPRLGDIDGNWRVVNGHRMAIRIGAVTFNENVFRSDGAPITRLTGEKETAPYVYIHNPRDAKAKSCVVVTTKDGSANFLMLGGPKYDVRAEDLPQPVVEADDITVYQPVEERVTTTIRTVSAIGPYVVLTKATSHLRGRMLVGAANDVNRRGDWKIIDFNKGKQSEKSFSPITSWSKNAYSIGEPFWSPDGKRFGLKAAGTGNDYMMTFGIYDAASRKFLLAVQPPYVDWHRFSPNGKRLAFAHGSAQVVGSSRVDDDYTLSTWSWDAGSKPQEHVLAADPSFIDFDSSEAMVCWRGSDELLVTQVTWTKGKKPAPKFEIQSHRLTGKGSKEAILERAWKPLVSPDGSLMAFYGPESKRQKPTQYYTAAPLDQSLCIARLDGKPMRHTQTGYSDRLPLARFGTSYPPLFWSPNSRVLYAVEIVSEGPNSFARVWAFNVRNGNMKRVAYWDYKYSLPSKSNDSNMYHWDFSGLSRDGKFLFATFVQDEANPDGGLMLQTRQWFRINLASGAIEKLMTLRGADFAWLDQT